MHILSIFRHNSKVHIVKYYTAQVCIAQGFTVNTTLFLSDLYLTAPSSHLHISKDDNSYRLELVLFHSILSGPMVDVNQTRGLIICCVL